MRIHYHMDFESISMQITKKCKCIGIIKQSAQNRLLRGNHRAHHKHFHWTLVVYPFKNHNVQCLKCGHTLCQGISIWFSCWSRAREVRGYPCSLTNGILTLKWRSEIALLNCPLRLQHQLLIIGCHGSQALLVFKAINCWIIFIFILSRSSL